MPCCVVVIMFNEGHYEIFNYLVPIMLLIRTRLPLSLSLLDFTILLADLLVKSKLCSGMNTRSIQRALNGGVAQSHNGAELNRGTLVTRVLLFSQVYPIVEGYVSTYVVRICVHVNTQSCTDTPSS